MHFCLTGYLVLFVVEEIVFSWARKFKLARLVIHLLRRRQFRWDFKDSNRFYLMCCLKSPPAYFKTIFIEHLLGQADLCKGPRTQDALWKCIFRRNGFTLSSKLPPQFLQHSWLLIVFCNLSRSLCFSVPVSLSHIFTWFSCLLCSCLPGTLCVLTLWHYLKVQCGTALEPFPAAIKLPAPDLSKLGTICPMCVGIYSEWGDSEFCISSWKGRIKWPAHVYWGPIRHGYKEWVRSV